MRPFAFAAAVGLLAWPLMAAPTESGKEETCGSYGTTLQFVDSPKEAAKRAEKEQKLVFILHVSGNFEDPTLT